MATSKSKTQKPATKAAAAKEEGVKRVSADDIQEVSDFMDIKQELDGLKADHPEIFRLYTDIVQRYNAALEAADKAVRARSISCGPFDLYSSRPDYNGEKMYEELGKELFLACGGSTVRTTEYKVDKAKVESAIASGKIPADCVKEFKSTRVAYHKPEKLSV